MNAEVKEVKWRGNNSCCVGQEEEKRIGWINVFYCVVLSETVKTERQAAFEC